MIEKEPSCDICVHNHTSECCSIDPNIKFCNNFFLTNKKDCTDCKYFTDFSGICDSCADQSYIKFESRHTDKDKKESNFITLCNKIKKKYKKE